VEQAIGERKREEDSYAAAHPASPDIKEKLARMRRQMDVVGQVANLRRLPTSLDP
jgi:hypothetical protein